MIGSAGLTNKDAANEFFAVGQITFDDRVTAAAASTWMAPVAGSISNWKIKLVTAPGGSGYTYTLHAGANTLTCAVTVNTLATCAGTLTVAAAGDIVYLENSNTGPTNPANSSNFTWSATFSTP